MSRKEDPMKALSLPTEIRIGTLLVTLSLIWALSPLHLNAQGNSPRSYRNGTRVYLDNGTIKVGLETAWGGSIVELAWKGTNCVNDFDTGREVQVAFYDGDTSPLCGDCQGAKGWDPVQGGDWHKHGSPILVQTVGQDSIYIKSQPHHWYPDNKGGPNNPVPGDIFIEQWVSLLPDYPTGVKVHYKVTHFGSDVHANSYQEFPAVYAKSEFNQFVYYGGTEPWTNGDVTSLPLPPQPSSPIFYTPELWSALVNNKNIGLTVFVPGSYPYAQGTSVPPGGPPNHGANYFKPLTFFSFAPGSVLEADIYLFGGDYRTARQAIYALKKTMPPQDPFAPDGSLDAPARDSVLKGTTAVTGWAFDTSQVSQVDVLVDEKVVGRADYGSVQRPDVGRKWMHAPLSIGFRYTLDTTKYPNGKHSIGVNVKNPVGNVAILRRSPVVIENPN
jgi:hypothetical protein